MTHDAILLLAHRIGLGYYQIIRGIPHQNNEPTTWEDIAQKILRQIPKEKEYLEIALDKLDRAEEILRQQYPTEETP